MTKKDIIRIIVVVSFVYIVFGSLFYIIIVNTEKRHDKFSECLELYPLDSCELYSCRVNYSSTITSANFNIRNYEICKIILNNNLSFNESLDLLNTITYDG